MLLILGNHDPLDTRGNTAPKQSVYITIPDEGAPRGLLDAIFGDGGTWLTYAQRGSQPRWVACEDPEITESVVGWFPGIEVRPVELPPPAPPVVPEPPITRAELRELIRAVIAEQRTQGVKA